MKSPLLQIGLAAAINAALLWIAASEFRRYGIASKVIAAYPIIGLVVWTFAEVAVENRSDQTPLVYAVLMGSVGVSVATDQAAGYILDVVTLPSCVFAIVTEASSASGLRPLAGAFALSGAMLFIYVITRRQGLGLGDVKLAAAIGALLGAQAGLVSLGVSFVFGGCAAALLMVSRGASRKMTVPFAPYIAAGALTVLSLARA